MNTQDTTTAGERTQKLHLKVARKLHMTIIERNTGHKIVIVTNRKGYVYAVTYAPDTDITREKVERDWKEDRRAFLPFDTVSMTYCDDKQKAYHDIF